MCFFCCYFCCPEEDSDVFESEHRAYMESKFASKLPRNCSDKTVITFIEQVRTKGTTLYERYRHRKPSHPKAPLLCKNRDKFGKKFPGGCKAKKQYLTCSMASLPLSDLSERTEDSVSISSDSEGEENSGQNKKSNSEDKDQRFCNFSRSGSYSLNGDEEEVFFPPTHQAGRKS